MRYRYIVGMFAVATVFLATNPIGIASAQTDAAKLKAYVEANGLPCLSCHGINNKIVGPAWIDVAKRYHGNPKALSEVTERIVKGGSGLWGQIPMPPGQATSAQAKELAKMILSLEASSGK